MSLNRSLIWHCHSDLEEPPSERKSFSGCDGYWKGVEDEEGGKGGGIGKGKFSMPKKEMCVRQMLDYALEMVHGSNTCLALDVEEKGLRAEESTEARQTVEEVVYIQPSCLVTKALNSHNRHQQCPNGLTATALLQCFASLLSGWPSYEVFNRCLLLGGHLVFRPSLLSFLPLSAGELLSLQGAKSRGA